MAENKKSKTSQYSRRDFIEKSLGLTVLGAALSSPLPTLAQMMPFGFWKTTTTPPAGPPLPPSTPGKLFSWGLGTTGRLGTGVNTTRSSPVQVGALTNWSKITANSASALAVKGDGTLWAWGVNTNGQYGYGDTITRSSPVQVGSDTNWTEVAFGGMDDAGSTFAIKSDGTLWGWGSNRFCVLNDPGVDNTDRSSPVQVGTGTNWKSISVSGTESATAYTPHVHAVKTDGTLWSWGTGQNGVLGVAMNRPRKLAFGNFSKASLNSLCGLGVRTDGSLWSWGNNSFGNLGDGTTTTRLYPGRVGALANWANVVSSPLHTLALKTDNTLWAWGINMSGEMGDSVVEMSASPIQIGGAVWSQVTASGSYWDFTGHSLGLRTDGTLWAWGANQYGELGLNHVPIQVGVLTNWDQVCVGEQHVLAIKTDGTLWAWGNNDNGRLGNGTSTASYSPIQIGALTNWAKLPKTTHGQSLAIKTDGTLWAWGANNYGELGTGDYTSYSSPVQVGTDTDWSQVEASDGNSYAIKVGQTLWGWGDNQEGQLGNSTTNENITPLQIGAGQSWLSIGTGENFCAAVTTSGTLWTWGNNGSGQLATGNNTPRSSPAQVGALTNWSAVYTGQDYVIARKTNGTLWAWGGNTYGNLGTGNTTARVSPVQVGALTDWTGDIACGYGFGGEGCVLAIKTGATLWAWGSNGNGQLGDNNPTRSSPVQIGALTTWGKVSSRNGTTIAIKTDGTLWAWGNRSFGRLGFGGGATHASSQVGTDTNWAQVHTGYHHTLAVKTNGTLWAWGYNGGGQLGIGNIINQIVPVQVGALTNWLKASAGAQISAAIKTDGTLWTWGSGVNGALGHGNTTPRSSPVQVGAATDWVDIRCGVSQSGEYMLARKSNGTIWAWGNNDDGQIGDGSYTTRSSPVQIGTDTDWASFAGDDTSGFGYPGAVKTDGSLWMWGKEGFFGATTSFFAQTQVGTDTNWHSVSAGSDHVVAVKTNGTIWAWGGNANGQLGDNSATSRTEPVQIGALTTWASASAGNKFTAAIKSDGTLWTWGQGLLGGLGDGTAVSKTSPVQVGALTNWKYVSCGKDNHALAVKTDNTLWAWGNGANGRLGNSSALTRSSPVQVGADTTWICVAASQSSSHGTKS